MFIVVFAAVGGAMGSVSDCQANGNHQPPPPPPLAGAEQVVEEGDAGGTINGNYQPPELVAEAGQVVQEGDAGVTMEGVSRHFHRLAAYWCHLRPFHSAPGFHLLLERKKANWVDHLLLVLAGRKKEELQVAGLLLRSWWREEHRRRCAGCSI